MKYLIIFLLLLPGLESIAQKNKKSSEENILHNRLDSKNKTLDTLAQKNKKCLEDNILPITLDFKNKIFSVVTNLEKLKKGGLFQLQIDSINMNLYKVVFDKKDTIISSGVTFPTFDLVNMGGVGELLGKLKEIAFSASSIEHSESDKQKITTFKSVEKSIDIYKGELVKGLKKIIEENSVEIQNSLKILVAKGENIDNLSLTIQKKIFSYDILTRTNPNYKLLSGDISFDTILLRTEKFRRELSNLSTKLKEQQDEYIQYTSPDKVKKIINDKNNTDLKDADKTLQEAYIKAISMAEKLYESINAEKVSSWIRELIYKDNNSSFSYKTLPQQLNGNQTKLNIQFIPAKEEYGLPSYQTEIHFPHRNPFYVGVGMSFYYAKFKNEVYSSKGIVVNDSTTNYQIVDEKNNKEEYGLTTLIHFGYRPFCFNKKADWFAVNLVMGPALSLTNTVKPRIAMGGGFAFGRMSMLTINGLYMAGYVDTKSEAFNTEKTYSSKPDNVTVSKIQNSFGISLGYIYKF